MATLRKKLLLFFTITAISLSTLFSTGTYALSEATNEQSMVSEERSASFSLESSSKNDLTTDQSKNIDTRNKIATIVVVIAAVTIVTLTVAWLRSNKYKK